jgi:hypothetical protein
MYDYPDKQDTADPEQTAVVQSKCQLRSQQKAYPVW